MIRHSPAHQWFDRAGRREEIPCPDAERESVDAVIARNAQAAQAVEDQQRPPRRPDDADLLRRPLHVVRGVRQVHDRSRDGGLLGRDVCTGDVRDAAEYARGWTDEDVRVDDHEVAADDALEANRNAGREDGPRQRVVAAQERIARDERIPGGEEAADPLIRVDVAAADQPHGLRASGCRGRGEQREREDETRAGAREHQERLRKFWTIVRPPSLAIDSGWNWTPQTGRVRWRTAWISSSQPGSSVHAITASSAGRLARSMSRE